MIRECNKCIVIFIDNTGDENDQEPDNAATNFEGLGNDDDAATTFEVVGNANDAGTEGVGDTTTNKNVTDENVSDNNIHPYTTITTSKKESEGNA